jgi:glutamyl-tRNA reductase
MPHSFKIIAFTHKTVDLQQIGKLHIEDARLAERLGSLKSASGAAELMFLSTCNRVEFLLSTSQPIDNTYLREFFTAFNPSWTASEIEWAMSAASVMEAEEALRHLFQVASSIDSLVVGEREIITQVRSAYENCHKMGLTGDMIRLVIKKTIETAKQVYTDTQIARKPVSVVSLAYRKLRELDVKLDAHSLIIGSGVTNSNMAKYLKKHGFKNFTVFNRTLENAMKLAAELNGKAHPLSELQGYTKGFDVIVTCTGAEDHIITKDIYTSLVGSDKAKKVVIDLAVPSDLDPEILKSYDVNLIAVNNLRSVAEDNLRERQKELDACMAIVDAGIEEFHQTLKTRRLEVAMSEVPRKVKEIRETAVNAVFAKEIGQLDGQSKELLDKILSYVEKKYISVPMKMAREILIEDNTQTKK